MNCLRLSPLSFWALAWALQVFIFSCWLLCAELDAPLALKQVLMKCLRASPVRFFVLASALQLVIFSCCEFSAMADANAPEAMSATASRIVFLGPIIVSTPREWNQAFGTLPAGVSLSIACGSSAESFCARSCGFRPNFAASWLIVSEPKASCT